MQEPKRHVHDLPGNYRAVGLKAFCQDWPNDMHNVWLVTMHADSLGSVSPGIFWLKEYIE